MYNQNADSILIVEDNDDMLFFLSDYFEDKYKIFTASNAEDGLEIVKKTIPDLIISDLMMPGMDGIAFCNVIKSNDNTSHIPFILLTAKDTDDARISGFKTGADDYINKPFNAALLGVRVENLFESRNRLQEKYRNTIVGGNTKVANELEIKDEFVQKIIDFVHENILEPELNVEKLSQILNMSRITLYRKVKALTGYTVIELIRSIRLKQAAKLLLTKKYNVTEVCYLVGFYDVDYFRKIFRVEFGIAPKEYCERNINK